MPITYSISRDERLIRAYASGIIRAEDLHGLIDAILADPDLGPGMRGLYDSRFGEPDITILQLAEVAGRVLKIIYRGLGKIAIVAESQTTYRVSQTFAVLARAIGIDVEVFTNLAEAEAWLDDAKGPSDSGEKPLPR
jgi:hypothetical protein